MAGVETTVERLRRFLRELTPQARTLLINEFERSMLRGDEAVGADLVLQELRALMREQREGAPRISNAARLFFKPLEPFLVDDRPDHVHPGRVARGSLELLWTWVGRDLMPHALPAFVDDLNKALAANDGARAEQLVRAFQDRTAIEIDAAFAAADETKTRRRLKVQIGTPRAEEDASVLKCVLKARDMLAAMAADLPLRIGNLTDDQLNECRTWTDAAAARRDGSFLCALLLVMSRLTAPWQLIRFGIKAAGTDAAARVAETPYGISVNIVLAELERMVGELRNDLRSGQGVAVGVSLKAIHDAARGLRTELDLPVDSTWGRALASQRAQISELLRAEIESVPGRVRRLLRARPASEIRANSVVDADEVAEVEALVAFVGDCRYFARELAINEMTQRAFSDLQHFLDTNTRALLDGLRHAGAADLSFRQSQLDAAVRFCAKVFGKDYAALLTKAAEVAATAERRSARA